MIVIKIQGRGKAINMLNGLQKEIPPMAENGIRRVAEFGAKELVKQMYVVGLEPWMGGSKSIFRDTEARKISSKQYGVYIPIHGIWQDRADPHFVPVLNPKFALKGAYLRKVDRWAGDKGFTGRGFYFRPRPFINTAFHNTVGQSEQIMREEIEKLSRRVS